MLGGIEKEGRSEAECASMEGAHVMRMVVIVVVADADLQYWGLGSDAYAWLCSLEGWR